MTVTDRVRAIAEPLVSERGFVVYDIERHGPILRITVSPQPGGEVPSIDDLTAISRAISRVVDEDDPVEGRYTLEVSSPGLERPLRTPDHFRGALGETVLVTARPPGEGAQRRRGALLRVDDEGIVMAAEEHDADAASHEVTIAYTDIEKARTVFEWGPTTKPGGGRSTTSTNPPAENRRSRP